MKTASFLFLGIFLIFKVSYSQADTKPFEVKYCIKDGEVTVTEQGLKVTNNQGQILYHLLWHNNFNVMFLEDCAVISRSVIKKFLRRAYPPVITYQESRSALYCRDFISSTISIPSMYFDEERQLDLSQFGNKISTQEIIFIFSNILYPPDIVVLE